MLTRTFRVCCFAPQQVGRDPSESIMMLECLCMCCRITSFGCTRRSLDCIVWDVRFNLLQGALGPCRADWAGTFGRS